MTKILVKNIEIQNPFTDSFVADILIKNGKIIAINNDLTDETAKILDGTNKIITPGLIDRHTHGAYGCNFNTCDEKTLQNYLINVKKHGITAVVPTIMTDSIENINRQINLIKNIKSKGAKILGIHLEGPFLNPNKKGIHPIEYILPLTKKNLEKLDLDFVKIMTFAPELDANGEFLKELLNKNIIPSIGHSECSYELANKVFQQGAKQITHIFNAISPIHHREPSVLTAALNNDDICVEVIMDLEHIHKAIIEMILKLKPKEKTLLISDSLPISYAGIKEDVFGGEKIFMQNNKATSIEGTLAGSTLLFDDIYQKVKDFIPFKDFIGYASNNIAKSLCMKNWKNIDCNCDNYIFWDKKTFKIIEF